MAPETHNMILFSLIRENTVPLNILSEAFEAKIGELEPSGKAVLPAIWK